MATISWLPVAEESDFSLANLPFGIVSRLEEDSRFPAVALGDYVLDLRVLVKEGAFDNLGELQQPLRVAFDKETLNSFAALGQCTHRKVRACLQELLRENTGFPHLLRDNISLQRQVVLNKKHIKNHLPMKIGDYTDFYVGKHHAYNVGVLFRGQQNALQKNYQHLPVGYHGRASTVVVSGTPIHRPSGQILPTPNAEAPIHSPSRKHDIELEMAAFICQENPMGTPVKLQHADSYIFGYVLMNDWSARDVQAWEYVPLGPFTSKNFGTTISPWIVLADALAPFQCETLEAESQALLLPYLRGSPIRSHDIALKVELKIDQELHVIAESNVANLYYSFEQMIAHHTVTGCALKTGDLLGSGAISGPTTKSRGSLLEITENGKKPLELHGSGGTISRTFLEDGDEVIITGRAGRPGAYVGFGECSGVVMPAWPL